MIRLVVLVSLAGCGRLEFDATGHVDGATPDQIQLSGHDEDSDGLDDAVDPCPGDPGTAADSDGDGVGDDCDPNPSTPTETLALFATLQPGDVPFDAPVLVDWTQAADGLTGSTDGISLNITRPLVTARIEWRFDIRAVLGAGQHQVASGVSGGLPTYYFVELNENPVASLNIESYDMTNGYMQLGTTPYPTFHTGAGLLRLDANSITQRYDVTAGWTGELYTAGASTPMYAGGPILVSSWNGIDVEVTSITIIETH